MNDILEGEYCASLLVGSVPHLNSDDRFTSSLTSGNLHDFNVNWEMAEVLLDLTSWALNHNVSGFGSDLDCTIKNYSQKFATYLPLGYLLLLL